MTAIADNACSAPYEVGSDATSFVAAQDIRYDRDAPEPLEHYVSAYCASCGRLCMVDVSVFEIRTRGLCQRCHRLFGHRVAGTA
jgi:hypothetical protein